MTTATRASGSLRRSRWPLTTVAVACIGMSALEPGDADPLDQLSGTDGWQTGGLPTQADELADWARGRSARRAGIREARIQAAVSRGIAALFGRYDKPPFAAVRQTIEGAEMQASSAPQVAPAPAVPPSAPTRSVVPQPVLRPRARLPRAVPGRPFDAADEPLQSERTDDSGQVVDEETERQVDKLRGKKKP